MDKAERREIGNHQVQREIAQLAIISCEKKSGTRYMRSTDATNGKEKATGAAER